MTTMYFRDADAAIIVYDVTDRSSLDMVKRVWLKDLHERAPENVLKVIIGNKCDLVSKNTDGDYESRAGGVSEKEGQEVAEECGAVLHRWVSAKKNQGINEMFQKLGDQLITQPSNVSSAPADNRYRQTWSDEGARDSITRASWRRPCKASRRRAVPADYS